MSRSILVSLAAFVVLGSLTIGATQSFAQRDPRNKPPSARPPVVRPNPPGIRPAELGIVRVRYTTASGSTLVRLGGRIQVTVWVRNFGGTSASASVDMVKGLREALPRRAVSQTIRPGGLAQFQLTAPVTLAHLRGVEYNKEYRRTIFIAPPAAATGSRVASFRDANQRNNFYLLRARVVRMPVVRITELRIVSVVVDRSRSGSRLWQRIHFTCRATVKNLGTGDLSSGFRALRFNFYWAQPDTLVKRRFPPTPGDASTVESGGGLNDVLFPDRSRSIQCDRARLRVHTCGPGGRQCPARIRPGDCFVRTVGLFDTRGRIMSYRETQFCLGTGQTRQVRAPGASRTINRTTYAVVCHRSRTRELAAVIACR